jgi:hypothetical protein
VENTRQICGKYAATTQQIRGKICSKYAAKFAANSRQNSRGKLECCLPQLCRDFATTFSEILQNEFHGKSRGKLTNTL